MNACVPFLPLYVRALGVTDFAEAQRWTGLVYAGAFMLSVVAVPFWGRMSDKYGRKLMIIRAIFGLTLAMFLMGFAQNVWQLFLLRIFQGGISGFIASSFSLVSTSTPQHKRGWAMSIIQTAVSGGTVVGPLVGGAIADAFGVRSLFLLVAGLCFLSGIVVVLYVQETPDMHPNKDAPHILDTVRFAWGSSFLRRTLLMIILVQAALNFTPPILPYFLESKGAPAELLATITGASVGLVGIFMMLFSARWGTLTDTHGSTWVMLRILPWLGLTTIVQGVIPHYVWIFPLRAIIGIFSSAAIPTLYTALSTNVPLQRAGSIMGLASSATLLGSFIAPILCSWLTAEVGMVWGFLVSGIFFFAALPVALSVNPHIQKSPASPSTFTHTL